MVNPVPLKSSSKVIKIINKAIEEGRMLSEFEMAQTIQLIDSMNKSHDDRSDIVLTCYYSIMSDIDGLLYHANKAIKDLMSYQDSVPWPLVGNIITALGNSLRFGEIHNLLEKYDIPLFNEIMISLGIKSYLFSGDLKGYERIKEEYSKNSIIEDNVEKTFRFLCNNKNYLTNISSYIIDSLDIISRKTSKRLIEDFGLLPISVFDVENYIDDGHEFISFVFFLSENISVDDAICLEDELIEEISNLNYPSRIKTLVTYSLFVDEGDQ
ncbi:TPA: hypothetical protein U2M51_003740 [Providencia rettgeri]|nr:hypothetical protein [Providencia rettgeri]